jgi:outer membrane autotransporter protein
VIFSEFESKNAVGGRFVGYLKPVSYRVLLLASVAGVALVARAHAANFINSTPTTNAGASYGLHSGDTLGNTSSITSTGAGQSAVQAGSGVSSITSSGLIQGTGANGIGVQVVSGGSVGSITNSGTVQATNGGNAIVVGDTVGPAGSVGTLTNSGLIQLTGGGEAVFIESGSSIGAIVNSGTILQTGGGSPQDAINVAGAAGLISNSGLIQGGTGGVGVRVEGAVGTINNAAGGTITGTGGGNAIYVVGTAGATGTVGTIANAGMIQSLGSGAAITVNGVGRIGAIANTLGGIIQTTGGGAAIADGGTIGTIANSGTIQTTAGGAAIAVNTAGASIGTITNTGLLASSGTNSAISVASGASIASIINSAGGVISPGGTNGNAISDAGSIGSISNSGLIQVAIPSDVAIYVTGTAGGIVNNAGGIIQVTGSNAADIRVDGAATSITNAGTLLGAGASGTNLGDTGVRVNGTVGTVSNSGLIEVGNGTGIHAYSGSIGSIGNTGTIEALSSGNAILIGNSAAASVGSIVNTGLLQGAGTNYAVSVQSLGTLGSLANNAGGVVQAAGTGGGLFVGGTLGSVSNAGTIMAQQGTAIAVGVGSSGTLAGTILNGITNTANGLIQGGPSNGSGVAISDVAGTSKLTINNAGTIIGAINLGPAGDTLNVTGGAVTGAIVGMAGSADVVNFSPTGTFATGGAISNIDTINVTSGTLVLQNAAASAFGASAFNIANGAVTDMNAGIQAGTVNNAGMLQVGSGSQSITGNYNQATTGALGVTVLGAGAANAGKLTVSGTATIQGGANAVAVHVPTTVNAFGLLGDSWHVLSSGTLIANAAALTASSDNPGIGFGLTDSSTDLILSTLAQTPNQVLAAAAEDVNTILAQFPGTPSFNQLQARLFLQYVFVGLVEHGQTALANQLFNVLVDPLSPAQAVQFNNQLMPSTLASVQMDIATTTNVLGVGESTIAGRLTSARLGTEQTGLAAGDQVGGGLSFWGQPFGALSSQGASGGFDGWDAGTYGITLGADTLVQPNIRVGMALTLSNTNVSYSGTLSGNTGSVFTGELALYGTWYLPNNFFLDGLLGVAYNHYNRHNLISALGLALDSDSGGTQLTAKLGAGYDYKLPAGAVITPYVSLQQFHFNFGSYSTTGGSAYGLDMHVNGESADLTQTRLGARIGEPVKLANGGVLTPEIHAYWLHDFGTNQLTTTYTTADFASPTSFTLIGPAMGRDNADIGISATFARGAGWSFSGGYDFVGGSGISTHNFYVQLKIPF